MLDQQLHVADGWQTAWLDRTYHPLRCYLSATSYFLTLTIIGLGLGGVFAIRRSTRKLRDGTSDAAAALISMHKKVLKLTRGHLIIGCIYLAHALVLTLADAGVSVGLLKEDVETEPEKWTPELYTEAALYAAYLLVVFMAAFILVPMLQMLTVTYLLSRFSRKTGSTSLSDYIPEARFSSTHIAQLWSMASFIVTAFWAPTESNTFWRYVILQACIGSAVVWTQAGFAFNYCAEQIESKNIEFGGDGLQGIFRMFSRTVKVVVYTYGSEKEALPQYVEVSQDEE